MLVGDFGSFPVGDGLFGEEGGEHGANAIGDRRHASGAGDIGEASDQLPGVFITAAERKRVSGSDCVIGTATAQASAPLLWGTGAELAVAGTGDGAGWAEAGCGA